MLLLIAAAMALGTAAWPAMAVSVFATNIGAGAEISLSDSDVAAVDTVSTDLPSGASADASGRASAAGLGAGSAAAVVPPSLSGDVDGIRDPLSISGGAQALLRVGDLVFSHDDPTVAAVSFSLNMPLTGSFLLQRSQCGDGGAVATASIDLGVFAPGETGMPTSIGTIRRRSERDTLSASNTGVFADLGLGNAMSIDALVVSGFYSVPVNVPVRLWLTLRTSASAVARDDDPVAARADFMNTLAFPRGDRVFILPDGATANSVQWGLADNRWSGTEPTRAPTPVPLPATGWMLVAGIGGLVAAGRRRRSRASCTPPVTSAPRRPA